MFSEEQFKLRPSNDRENTMTAFEEKKSLKNLVLVINKLVHR